MKIVVLDGYTLNPGDLNWRPLQALGYCEIYNRTSPESIVARAHQADILLTNKTILTREHLAQLPDLKYIGVLATGYNHIVDIAAAQERQIVVTNASSYGTSAVAQQVFALILELTRHLSHHIESVRAGRWSAQPDFCYWDMPLIDLEGLTLGIVGLGQIGQKVAEIAQAFDMKVLTCTPSVKASQNIKQCDLDELFRESDIISLHCPLTEVTTKLVNERRLALMKSSALLINSSRGGLVDEAALFEALQTRKIAGAGLDVLTHEPPDANNPLFNLPNCVITPHIAWATGTARQRLLDVVVENVRSFLQGKPENVVN
jgi:glycerate dehydrogenase